MKIVEVVHGFPPEVVGGTECYVQRIAEGLLARKHQVHVYAGSLKWMEAFTVETEEQGGLEVTKVHRHDLYFDRWDKAYNPLVEESFSAYLKAHRPDVVHVHHWVRLTSNLAAIAARAGIPSVVTLHDLYGTCPRFFRQKEDGSCCELELSPENCLHSASRWLFQRDPEIRRALAAFKEDMLAELQSASRILAPSATHAATVKSRLALKDLAIETLPHGRISSLSPAPRPPKGSKLQVVYFSHLYPDKGPMVLLEAFRRMKRRDGATLHYFGGEVLPDFAQRLREAAAGLDVSFHGPYRPEQLQAFPMDLVVIPTLLSESYSFILDEAADLKVPVAASESGAIPERSTPSVMLFPRGNADALAAILDRAAADRGMLDRLRTTPAARVMPMDEHLDRLEKVYAEAAREGVRRKPEDRCFELLKDQWERREYGFKELIRSEQWEYLVASLRKRIVELEMELSARRGPGAP